MAGGQRYAAAAAAGRRDAGRQERPGDPLAEAQEQPVQVTVGKLEESDQQQASAQESSKKPAKDEAGVVKTWA
jgi:hypothetical protein